MVDQKLVSFDAVDTLMFRDGRPFNQADAGASRAVSMFPPYPPTLVGALRAAQWRQSGKAWDKDKLGDGTNWQDETNTTLGPMVFGAPLVLKDNEPLFPVPLNVVEGKRTNGSSALTFLKPGPARECDLGSATRLPVPKDELEGIKPIENRWVTLAGMKAILDGRLPDDQQLVGVGDLWETEARVGVGITAETRTTDDGRLYMASHIRLRDGVKLGFTVSGTDGLAAALRPLAGEHRMAEIGAMDHGMPLPAPPKALDGGRYSIIQLSPLVLNTMPGPGGTLEGLPGTLVSACLGKPVPVGGWDSQNKRSIPLRLAVPAGSVWFIELGNGETLDWSQYKNGIGVAAKWGFGQILIGKW